jgi:hypothetical protein
VRSLDVKITELERELHTAKTSRLLAHERWKGAQAAMDSLEPKLRFQRGTLPRDLALFVFGFMGRRVRQRAAAACKWFREVRVALRYLAVFRLGM